MSRMGGNDIGARQAVLAGVTGDQRAFFSMNIRAHATVGLGDLVPIFKTQTCSWHPLKAFPVHETKSGYAASLALTTAGTWPANVERWVVAARAGGDSG